MLDKKAYQRQSLDMLPVMIDKVRQAIDASEKAREQLESDYPHLMPPDLWNDEQCLIDHEGQIEQLILLRQQITFWRKNNYLTPAQKIELLHLEISIGECEKISQQVIFMLTERLK